MRLIFFAVLVFLSFSVSQKALAQSKPKSFYGSNFAKSQMDEGKTTSSSRDEAKKDTAPSVRKEMQPRGPIVKGAPGTEQEEQEEGEEENIFKGIKIDSIGVIFNALDESHLIEITETILEISEEKKIPIGPVYPVGYLLKPETQSIFFKLMGRGAAVKVRRTIPSRYEIKKSPAWIIDTEKGEYLLEGITNPSSYISAKGEFVENKPFFDEQEKAKEEQKKQVLDIF